MVKHDISQFNVIVGVADSMYILKSVYDLFVDEERSFYVNFSVHGMYVFEH